MFTPQQKPVTADIVSRLPRFRTSRARLRAVYLGGVDKDAPCSASSCTRCPWLLGRGQDGSLVP